MKDSSTQAPAPKRHRQALLAKSKARLVRHIILLLCGGFLWSCPATAKGTFTIVATTGMLGDALRNIVQEHAQVITLMGPGVDPHAYKATQRDVQHLLKADIVFYNGLHLEGRMADILKKLSKKRPIHAAGDAIPHEQLIIDPDFPMGIDPHIWFDVQLWMRVVQYMSTLLQAAHPQKARYYQANTTTYLQQLANLDRSIAQAIQEIPALQRVLITAHDAFGYFGRAYAMEVRGLQGISTVSECGLRDVTDLVEFIIERNIKALFLETSVPERPLKAVVEGCRQRGHPMVVGGYLYSDALGQEGTPTGTYYGMVQANVQAIINALK
ncbi:MAG: zinc ABC transporter substrate-binding protein [Bacteroidota bacterium]